jgi:hypothetical protein
MGLERDINLIAFKDNVRLTVGMLGLICFMEKNYCNRKISSLPPKYLYHTLSMFLFIYLYITETRSFLVQKCNKQTKKERGYKAGRAEKK